MDAEVEAYGRLRANVVADRHPALRWMAAEVVAAEGLFHGRTAGLDQRTRAEVEQTVRRVVDKLLHGSPSASSSDGRGRQRQLRAGAARTVQPRSRTAVAVAAPRRRGTGPG